MTAPTITYGHGIHHDCDTTTSWTNVCTITLTDAGYTSCVAGDIGKQVSDDGANIGLLTDYDNSIKTWWIATASLVVAASAMAVVTGTGVGVSKACIMVAARSFSSDGDVFTLGGTTADTARVEAQFVEYDFTNISDVSYPSLLIRYKTSVASGGLQAQVVAVYADGSTSTHVLGYNVNWATSTVTPDSATSSTISKIRLYAIEDAAANANSTYNVYYDFVVVCAGTFTFPYVGPGGVKLTKTNRYADIPIPGRIGDITQYMGAESDEIEITGSIDTGTGWHLGADTWDAEILYAIFHEANLYPWYWFTSDLVSCKVTPRTFPLTKGGDDNVMETYTLTLKRFDQSSGSGFGYAHYHGKT